MTVAQIRKLIEERIEICRWQRWQANPPEEVSSRWNGSIGHYQKWNARRVELQILLRKINGGKKP